MSRFEVSFELKELIADKVSHDGQYAIAAAILELAGEVGQLALEVKYLAAGDHGEQMGAVEFLARKVDEAGSTIAGGLERVAEAVQNVVEHEGGDQ